MPSPTNENKEITTNVNVPNADWTDIQNPNMARHLLLDTTEDIWFRLDEPNAPAASGGFPLRAGATIPLNVDKPPGFDYSFNPDPARIALQVRSQLPGALARVKVYWIRE